MRLLTMLILATSCAAQLPNHNLTPGAVRTTNAAEICAKTFRTGPYRHTTLAMKKQVCRSYGVTQHCPEKDTMELDHLIPLELGGADEITNLWPEYAHYKVGPGFHEKDKVENALKRKVCSGQMSLTDAQKAIAEDWIKEYNWIH